MHQLTTPVTGFGRLRRPPSQPAYLHVEPGTSISVVSVTEPGNRKVEAGSASAGALAESQDWTGRRRKDLKGMAPIDATQAEAYAAGKKGRPHAGPLSGTSSETVRVAKDGTRSDRKSGRTC